MALFYRFVEDSEPGEGTVFFDDESAKSADWDEYLKKGRLFFRVAELSPLAVEVWWKSSGCSKIDQFSHLRLGCENSLEELVSGGVLKTPSASLILPQDCEKLDIIARDAPELLVFAQFDFGMDGVARMAPKKEKSQPSAGGQGVLFDMDIAFGGNSSAEGGEKSSEPARLIKKISTANLEAGEIKAMLADFECDVSEGIAPDSDMIVYSDNTKFARGNYAPFVIEEKFLIPKNCVVLKKSLLKKFLDRHSDK